MLYQKKEIKVLKIKYINNIEINKLKGMSNQDKKIDSNKMQMEKKRLYLKKKQKVLHQYHLQQLLVKMNLKK